MDLAGQDAQGRLRPVHVLEALIVFQGVLTMPFPNHLLLSATIEGHIYGPEETIPRLHADPACAHGGADDAAIGPLWAPENQEKLSKGEADAVDCAVLRGTKIDRSDCWVQLQADAAENVRKTAEQRTQNGSS